MSAIPRFFHRATRAADLTDRQVDPFLMAEDDLQQTTPENLHALLAEIEAELKLHLHHS